MGTKQVELSVVPSSIKGIHLYVDSYTDERLKLLSLSATPKFLK